MKKIIILEGGFNEEHEVSLNSSKEVQQSLKKLSYNYEVIKVDPLNFEKNIKSIDQDCILFNALHGTFGEDGTIQKILEDKEFIYTHSNSDVSKIAFNKNLTKIFFEKTEIPFIESKIIEKKSLNINLLKVFFNEFNSFIIKPVSSGSSFGVKIFDNIKDIEKFTSNLDSELSIYKDHDELMIEKYIKGKELTVCVIENEKKQSESLEVTEIIPKNFFYDYDSKYIEGRSEHIIPANIPKEVYQNCLRYSKIAHDKLNCRGISRSDFIYDGKNIYFLEINTQPGLTGTSLAPEQAEYRNINFDQLVIKIIEAAYIL